MKNSFAFALLSLALLAYPVKAQAPYMVKDIWQGYQASVTMQGELLFAELGGAAYFVADDGTTGRELWKTDGSAAGTLLVTDVISGAI
ncbi:MAG: hypothetical protein EOO03_13785, partial [Chitinophagaceae bacterium]